MLRLTMMILLFSTQALASVFPGVFSGELQTQLRYFPNAGDYGNEDRSQKSAVFKLNYANAWDNDRRVLNVQPFFRYDEIDEERSHADLRELSFVSSGTNLDWRIGISKVFWGVTESRHLVDVINQTDFVENPDGEQKLGQPMINPTWVGDLGQIDLFILPYFRERTFAGTEGRYRFALPIDTSTTRYLDARENRHIDYALRWSHYWRDMEWALSYFDGTERDPDLQVDSASQTLVPVYGQSRQLGGEWLYVYQDLIVKAELLRRESDLFGLYTASTAGFEYTLFQSAGRMDIGLLYEWLYDSRGEGIPDGLNDASFIGARIAVNDADSSEALIGAIIDNDNSDLINLRIEASRRLASNLLLAFEVNVIDSPPSNSILNQFRHDDYLEVSLSYHF